MDKLSQHDPHSPDATKCRHAANKTLAALPNDTRARSVGPRGRGLISQSTHRPPLQTNLQPKQTSPSLDGSHDKFVTFESLPAVDGGRWTTFLMDDPASSGKHVI